MCVHVLLGEEGWEASEMPFVCALDPSNLEAQTHKLCKPKKQGKAARYGLEFYKL